MPWSIDPVRSHIGFSVKHMVVATVRGEFRKYSATIVLDPHEFARSTFEGEVEMASVDTGSAERDAQLRTNELLDVAHHPKLFFKSTRIEGKSRGKYVVRGDLTIRGVTRPVTLEAEYQGTAKNSDGRTVARITARGTIQRSEFGVTLGPVLEAGGVALAEKVKLEVQVEAYAEDAASSKPDASVNPERTRPTRS